MIISVFGLGYVGSVTAACLANNGHTVVGVDVNDVKVRNINDGKSPIIETQINSIIELAVKRGMLKATLSTDEAILTSDVSLICVGTPGNGNGSLNLRHIEACCEHVGRALRKKSEFHTVVIRSTVLPGSTRGVIVPILEKYSGKTVGVEFGICANPEFLREGTSVQDFLNLPFNFFTITNIACGYPS